VADHHSRYRIILIADIGRAALLASIPVTVLFGDLRYWLLVLVAFCVGTLTLFFNVAFQAYLPSLVPPPQVAVANARLGASQSAAEVTGPGLAAGLIALGGSAVAVAADAASYVFSGRSRSGSHRPIAPSPVTSVPLPARSSDLPNCRNS
jgi:MFS family permease